MEIEFDRGKRDITWQERGIDFADAAIVFAGPVVTAEDRREDYGELRYITFGILAGRLVAVIWTPRDGKRRIISMRKANEREKNKIIPLLGF